MTINNLDDMIEIITSLDTNIKTIHGFNDAVLGYVIGDTHTQIAYSVNAIMEILQKKQKMTFLEATAILDEQILKLHRGKGKPIFIYKNNKNLGV